jgi:hypothetical protein
MDTAKIGIEDVTRGSMIPGGSGITIAETLSADERGTFWHGTDGRRHYGDSDGLMVVFVPTVRTQAYGQSREHGRHALLNPVPGREPQGLCPGSRNAELTVWESGIALYSVTCDTCRRMLNLVPNAPRQSNGI